MEDESRQLGQIGIPDPLYQQICKAPLIKIYIPKSFREERLVKEYGLFDKPLLKEMIEKIRKRLGGAVTAEALKALETGDLGKVASLTLLYYDKSYDYGSLKRDPDKILGVELEKDDPAENAEIVKELLNKI